MSRLAICIGGSTSGAVDDKGINRLDVEGQTQPDTEPSDDPTPAGRQMWACQ